MTTPIPEAAVEAPIITYANTFAGGDPVNDLAIVLMKQWGESDPTSIVALFPVSFVANFVDMARTILTAARPLMEAEALKGAASWLFVHGGIGWTSDAEKALLGYAATIAERTNDEPV